VFKEQLVFKVFKGYKEFKVHKVQSGHKVFKVYKDHKEHKVQLVTSEVFHTSILTEMLLQMQTPAPVT